MGVAIHLHRIYYLAPYILIFGQPRGLVAFNVPLVSIFIFWSIRVEESFVSVGKIAAVERYGQIFEGQKPVR